MTVVLSWGVLCPPGHIWQCLKTFLIVTIRVGTTGIEWLEAKMQLNILQYTGQPCSEKLPRPKCQQGCSLRKLPGRGAGGLELGGTLLYFTHKCPWIYKSAPCSLRTQNPHLKMNVRSLPSGSWMSIMCSYILKLYANHFYRLSFTKGDGQLLIGINFHKLRSASPPVWDWALFGTPHLTLASHPNTGRAQEEHSPQRTSPNWEYGVSDKWRNTFHGVFGKTRIFPLRCNTLLKMLGKSDNITSSDIFQVSYEADKTVAKLLSNEFCQ